MRFCRYEDIPETGIRRSYRAATWRALGAAALFMGVITAYIALPKGDPTNPVLVAVPGLLTVFLTGLMLLRYRESGHKNNWLLLEAEDGLYINLHAPGRGKPAADAEVVLFIDNNEIGAVGKTIETRYLPDRNGTSVYHWSHIDVYLNHEDVAPLATRLREQRFNPAGKTTLAQSNHATAPPAVRSTMQRRTDVAHVRVVDPTAVRLMWDWIRPAEDAALRALGETYEIAPDRELKHARWEKLSDAEKERAIADLWEYGHAQEAHRAVRIHHQLSARAAWEHLEGLV